MLGPMRDQRLAGADRTIQHVIPCVRIVERAEDNAADQFEVMLGQPIGQNRRVFRHEANGTKLDPLVPGFGVLFQNRLPRRVARIIREFHTPGAGRVANPNHGSCLP